MILISQKDFQAEDISFIILQLLILYVLAEMTSFNLARKNEIKLAKGIMTYAKWFKCSFLAFFFWVLYLTSFLIIFSQYYILSKACERYVSSVYFTPTVVYIVTWRQNGTIFRTDLRSFINWLTRLDYNLLKYIHQEDILVGWLVIFLLAPGLMSAQLVRSVAFFICEDARVLAHTTLLFRAEVPWSLLITCVNIEV